MSEFRIVFATADVTAAYGQLVLCDPTAGAFTVHLPAPSIGLRSIAVKKAVDSFNNITVARSGSALIDGETSVVLSNANQAVTLIPNGTNWMLVASVSGVSPSATVPGAPAIGTAVAGVLEASVAFTPPGSDGGSAITGYTATSSPGGITGTGASSPINVSGLTAGTAYTFTVHATNAVGNSTESAASNSVTPTAMPTAPAAPTIGAATAGDNEAAVTWTAGGSGGSPITDYQIKTYSASGTLLATDLLGGTGLIFTKTGLTAGVDVKFKVAAVNAIGTGTLSAFSNTVTPGPFDFSSISGLIEDFWAGSVTGLSDGQTITSVPAGSGLSNALTVTGGMTYKTSALGGRPAMRCDGTQVCTASSDGGQKPVTVFVVLKYTDAGVYNIIRSSGVAGGLQWYANNSGALNLILDKTATASIQVGGVVYSLNTPYVFGLTFDATAAVFYEKDVVSSSVAASNPSLTSSATCKFFSDGGSNHFTGDVFRLLTWNRVLTGAEITTVANALASYYGI